jgi:hypothetical protein
MDSSSLGNAPESAASTVIPKRNRGKKNDEENGASEFHLMIKVITHVRSKATALIRFIKPEVRTASKFHLKKLARKEAGQ